MNLEPDFNEFIACLTARDVRYLVVGGYAVAAHGLPRATKDFDVWVWVDPQNAAHLIDALDDFGFGTVGLTQDDFTEEDRVVQLGYPPVRIDLLTSIDGVRFEEAYPHRLVTEIDGQRVVFIGRDQLIANKLATGRPQDLADAARLRVDRDAEAKPDR